MFGQLIPAGGGQPIPLLKESIIVGRSAKCDVHVPHNAVSGRHCQLKRKNGYWWVIDLDSRNGTGINGTRVRTKRILPNEILCVPKMRFRIVYKAPHAEEASTAQQSEESSLALSVLNEPSSGDGDSAAAGSTASRSTIVKASSALTEGGKQKSTLQKMKPKTERSRPDKTSATSSDPNSRTPSGTAPPVAASGSPSKTPSSDKAVRRYLGKLVPRGGGDPIALLDPKLVVGRSRDTDIRLKTGSVSSRHCMLTHEEGYWFVEDLGSSNGVRVNGERIERKLLMPGDKLSISSQKFNIEYEPEGPIPMDRHIPTKSLLDKAGLSSILESDDAPAWLTSHESNEEDAPRKYTLGEDDP